MSALVPYVALLLVLLVCSAFFSCSETAFFSLSRVDLRRLREGTGAGARRLVQLLRAPRETLIGILLGNELANNAIAVFAAQAMSLLIVDAWMAILLSIVLVTPVVLLFGEVIPKNLAVGYASRISPGLAVPMAGFLWITTPIRRVLTLIADSGVRLFGGDPKQVRAMIMEEEFRHLVDLGEKVGALSESERSLIHGVFTFSDMMVEDMMTPASKIFRVPLSWEYDKILEEVRAAHFSRIPVYQENPNDIIGILYARDLVALQARKDRGLAYALEEIVRPVIFVKPDTRVEEVLEEFQRKTVHMALVVDARHRTVGLVTMDDVLDTLIARSKDGVS